MAGSRTLIAFAREPDAATCKTRLAPVLSPEERVAFYKAMLADLAETMEQVSCDRRIVAWTGERRGETCVAPTQWASVEQFVQVGKDLGERMLNALSVGAAEGSAVLVGSDAPLLSAADMNAAFELLERRHLVLTPSFDGGYCLIGARADTTEYLPTLFDGMTWSHPRVFEETLERIRRIQAKHPAVAFGLLPMRYDIDAPEDLARLATHLAGLALAGEAVPRHTYAFLAGRRV